MLRYAEPFFSPVVREVARNTLGCSMMSLSEVTESIRGKLGEDSDLDATVKLDLGETGVVYIDATQTPNTVSNEDKEADCVLQVSVEDLRAMSTGELSPTAAFMEGKLVVTGDMGIAMKLQSLF